MKPEKVTYHLKRVSEVIRVRSGLAFHCLASQECVTKEMRDH